MPKKQISIPETSAVIVATYLIGQGATFTFYPSGVYVIFEVLETVAPELERFKTGLKRV